MGYIKSNFIAMYVISKSNINIKNTAAAKRVWRKTYLVWRNKNFAVLLLTRLIGVSSDYEIGLVSSRVNDI